jgi:hypothetical protein
MRPTWKAEFLDAFMLDVAALNRRYAEAGFNAGVRYCAERQPDQLDQPDPPAPPDAAEIAAAVASAVAAVLAAAPAKSRRRSVIRDVDGEITAVVDEEIQP